MTDKKIGNIKAIRAGIEIKTEENSKEPLPELVSGLETLLADAKSGELRELCFTGVYGDKSFRMNILGEVQDYSIMQNLIKVLETDYFELVTYPILTGAYSNLEE